MVREQASMNYQYGWNEDRFKAQSGRSRLAGRACGATNSRLATHRDDARLGNELLKAKSTA